MQGALMWLNLYGREAVQSKLINSLKTQKMHYLPVFELTSDSLSTNPTKLIFFCFIPMKISQSFWVARVGQNLDDYSVCSKMRSWANNYAEDCIVNSPDGKPGNHTTAKRKLESKAIF
jgi:hypothetical protein